ncbi:hypothetical protein CC117_19880 [Parafrankia colletiae]|uniref:Uncharacterized protein n=1 Tax=Parafrankia colletiae TaxID=573497 RepID=A0A1S1QRP4_9ACTN|nr:hypothetical protein [Parafrankia colletiae]MCK9898898.1 hypothetical protein [Frankia sp. Cpl3]OHV35054.1 hypothetical protein CC117_19880 [Parafrankia colletiae]
MNTDELPAELTAALARLATLPGRPAAEHLEVFEDVHRLLEESLQDLAGGPAGRGVPGPPAGSGPHAGSGVPGVPGAGGARAPR